MLKAWKTKSNCDSSYYITSPSSFCYSTVLRAYWPVAVGSTISLRALTEAPLALGPTWTSRWPIFSLIRALVTSPHPERCVEALRFVWGDIGLKVDRDHTWWWKRKWNIVKVTWWVSMICLNAFFIEWIYGWIPEVASTVIGWALVVPQNAPIRLWSECTTPLPRKRGRPSNT